jgi:hypothetical protein
MSESFYFPGVRNTDPVSSLDGARQAARGSALLADRIVALLARYPKGLTGKEISVTLALEEPTTSPRLRPLARAGRIVSCGKRRNASGVSAIVWKLVLIDKEEL